MIRKSPEIPPTESKVLRRTVFYISGFDPRGPRHYYQLYTSQSLKQSAVNGQTLEISKRKSVDKIESSWSLTAGDVHTDYRFLRYDDIIREQWAATALAMYGGVLRYSLRFLRVGVFGIILRNSWPSFVAVVYPPALVLGNFLLAALLALLMAKLLQPWVGGLGYLLVIAAMALPFLLYRPLEKWLNVFWLARSCTFLVDRSLGRVPGIEERCKAFADRVAEAVNSDENDEVLIASHSVGTHLAITIVARALEKIGKDRRISLLTMGQATAMTPDEPMSRQFREDMLAISISRQIDWIDVTSAIDGSCIPLSDMLDMSGIARPDGVRRQPKLVSARFNKLFTAETYAGLRRDFLRTHFQYLMAAELPGDYDYFLITAGDKTLAARFAHLESVTTFNRFRIGKQ